MGRGAESGHAGLNALSVCARTPSDAPIKGGALTHKHDIENGKVHFEVAQFGHWAQPHQVAKSAEASTDVGRTRECIPLGSYRGGVGDPNTIRPYFSQLVLRCIPAPRTPPIRRICAGAGFY